jgi:hypothetical protein
MKFSTFFQEILPGGMRLAYSEPIKKSILVLAEHGDGPSMAIAKI